MFLQFLCRDKTVKLHCEGLQSITAGHFSKPSISRHLDIAILPLILWQMSTTVYRYCSSVTHLLRSQIWALHYEFKDWARCCFACCSWFTKIAGVIDSGRKSVNEVFWAHCPGKHGTAEWLLAKCNRSLATVTRTAVSQRRGELLPLTTDLRTYRQLVRPYHWQEAFQDPTVPLSGEKICAYTHAL